MIVLAAGCGRFGFGITDAGDTGSGRSDGSGSIDAGTTSFGETPTATVNGVTFDTQVSNEAGSTGANFGASTTLECQINQKRVLFRFDLSALAPETVVVSAQLHVGMSGGSGTTTIYPVLESWTVGTQNGTAGVANNTQRTAVANWTTAGALPPGSAGSAIATFTMMTGWNAVTLPAATVQGWINTPGTNFGVMIDCGGDDNVHPSESSTATQRPQLDVVHL